MEEMATGISVVVDKAIPDFGVLPEPGLCFNDLLIDTLIRRFLMEYC